MAINTVFGYSSTAASNTDVAGNGITGSSSLSLGNDAIQNIMAQIASGVVGRGSDIATAGTLSFDGASTPSLVHDLTGTTTVTAITLTAGQWRLARAQGAFTLTASATLVVNGSTSTSYTTTAGDLLVVFGYSASTVRVWTITGGAAASITSQLNTPVNLGLAASVGSSALTVALKGVDGNDPSATNPVVIPFRNVTAATGTPSYLTATAATSIVISSGSTMGFTSAVIGRLWVVAFNDAGTLRLGLVNALSGTSIMFLRDGIYSSTAEGGAGAADSAQVIYTGTAVTSKAMTVLGYLEATEATAGTWATAPSLIKLWQPGDPLPGDTIQRVRNTTGAVATGTTTVPADDTIPQNTEGTQFMSQAITPASGANLLAVDALLQIDGFTNTGFITALFRDSAANAVWASYGSIWTATAGQPTAVHYLAQALSTTTTTFKVRAGFQSAGTITLNGSAGARLFGGVSGSSMDIAEILA